MGARVGRGIARRAGAPWAAAMGALSVVAAASPAQAAIVVDVDETFVGTPPSLTCEAPDGSTFTLSRAIVAESQRRLKVRRPGSDELFLELRYVDRLRWTNETTGISFTGVVDAQEKDTALVESRPDGTYDVLTVLNGRTTFYGPDGSRAGKQVGVERYLNTLDSNGTPDPDDDSYLGGELLLGAGNPGRSVCDLAVELTLG